MWLPDLFAELWLRLVPRTADIYSDDWHGLYIREADSIREMIRSAKSAETPDSVLNYLEGARPIRHDVADPDKRAFVVARCIDDCLEPFHPRYRQTLRGRRARMGLGLHEIDSYYLRHGRFNKSTESGLILPKAPLRPGWIRRRPDVSDNQLRDRFRFLSYYREPELREHTVSVRKLPEYKDIDGRSIARQGLRIAVIPLATYPNDLSLRTREDRRGRLDIEPDPSREELLADRASAALFAANAEGAQIALFPELVVSLAVRKAIVETLRQITETDGTSALQLVAAGSGACTDAGRTYNECVVFNGYGWPLWRQRKLTQYSPPAERLERWGAQVSRREKYRENYHGGGELQVIDSSGGRMTVLICQDLFEDKPSGRVMRELRPDWVFCPVLDSELEVGRWMHQQSMPLAARYGVSVIVVNNLDLPRRERPRGRKFGVALCVDRDEPYRCNIAKCQAPPQRLSASRQPVFEVIKWRPFRWPPIGIGFRRSRGPRG